MNIEELKVKALANDFDAIKELAERMWMGDGVKKDQDATFELWKVAYELNPLDNLVTKRMGSCYRFGHGVQADNNIAKKYYLEAANRDDSASQYFLGKIFEENNDIECISWYEKALSNGDLDSAVMLASIYIEGKLVNRNLEKANDYLKIVNDSKNADAVLDVMRLYYFGTSDGSNKDIYEAIDWCKKAVECGSTVAVGNLSALFDEAEIDKEEYYKYIVETAVNCNNEALIRAYKYYYNLGGQENAVLAFEYLSKAIANEYSPACYEMGSVYFNGLCGCTVDKNKAIEYWQMGSEKKEPCSMVMMAYVYLDGELMEKNADLAVQILKEASELGNITATRELGVMYLKGNNVETDYEKAYNYFSSLEDDEDSLAYLGLMYIYGRHFEKDNQKGIELILEAINKGSTVGKKLLKEAFYNNLLSPEEDYKVCMYLVQKDNDAESMWHLYLSYKNGDGVEKDSEKAMQWLEKAIEYKESKAMLEMMKYYYFGDVFERDLKKAEEWCKLAVLNGNRRAVNNLLTIEKELLGEDIGYKTYLSFILTEAVDCNDEALMAAYEYYSKQGDKKYYDIAFNYLEKAYEKKNPTAFFKIGGVFFNGELGKLPDKEKAYEYWLIGTHNGETCSMNMVGNAYITGEGLPKDTAKGIELLQKSAYGGNEVSALDLAKYYMLGSFIEGDMNKAIQYYKMAADLGNAEAQNEIGSYYIQATNGFPKDDEKAFELFEKSSEGGNTFAQYNLGLCYYNGWGTVRDIDKAIFWWEKAAEKGHADAINNLKIAKTVKEDNHNFVIQNGTLTSYNGCADNINVPEGVTCIANGAFYSATNNYKRIGIAGIILPSSLRSIDENAFTDLLVPWVAFGISEHNKYFSVQDGVLFNKDKTLLIKYPIDKQGFEYTVPNTVKQISPNAFKYARNLRKLVLSSSLENIGEEAIVALSNLQYVDFSKTKLVELPKSICSSCNNLIEVNFPPNLRKVGWGGFFGDNSLRQVILPNGLTEIAECAFGNCSNLTNLVIPKTIMKIGESAFSGCERLNSLEISRTVSLAQNAIPNNCRIIYISDGLNTKNSNDLNTNNSDSENKKSGGCYVATCVYGSYDCPPVWTLRRYRDNRLSKNPFGRAFIKIYYATSPTIVKYFGSYSWFHKLFKKTLDKFVTKLKLNGYDDTPYQD